MAAEGIEAKQADGCFLTKKELSLVLQQLDKDEWSDAKSDSLFDSFDVSGEGRVPLDKFIKWLTAGPPRVPDAAAKLTMPRRLLLVSDNLPLCETIIRAALDNVVLVPVKYDSWDVGDLREAIRVRAGEPDKQFASIGLLDHGKEGEFCFLRRVAGGRCGKPFLQSVEGVPVMDFFRWLSGYVKDAKEPSEWKADNSRRIDIMGCSVGGKKAGADLLEFLEEEIRVNFAASTDATGGGEGVEGGFDWMMESDGVDVSAEYFSVPKLKLWHQSCPDYDAWFGS